MAHNNEAHATAYPVGDAALGTVTGTASNGFAGALAKNEGAQLVSLSEEEEYICNMATD